MSLNDPIRDLEQIREAKRKSGNSTDGADIRSCPICGTTVVGEGNLRSHVLNSEDEDHRGKMLNSSLEVVARYKIESQLRRHYVEKEKSQQEIADEWGCGRNTIYRWLKKHGIDRKNRKGGGENRVEYVNYSWNEGGYWGWRDFITGRSVQVHQLLVISEGADPSKVFSDGEYQVHHENGVPWDNRPDNVRLLSRQEHLQEHGDLQTSSETDWSEVDWGVGAPG